MGLKKIGALWKPNRDTKAVLTGKLEDGTKVMLFKNTYKEPGDKKPDFELLAMQDDQDTGRRDDFGDDDIPF